MSQYISAFKEMLSFFRPVYTPRRKLDNFVYAGLMLIEAPTIFLKPVFVLGAWALNPNRKGGWVGLSLALIHLLLAPVLLIWCMILPFLCCRIYLHTPAAQMLLLVKSRMMVQKKAETE